MAFGRRAQSRSSLPQKSLGLCITELKKPAPPLLAVELFSLSYVDEKHLPLEQYRHLLCLKRIQKPHI
ncbi:hypothetical protein MUK42_07296 [Musa troglodytarum]|uniref:Uncharacterized protein n=1 Tax=Musa troglodytarum TaxID=320322 RepID=A0A9E7HGC4_9LILI|nr:hypothetical protein MUK42_07296 [Musa troglodytarum]